MVPLIALVAQKDKALNWMAPFHGALRLEVLPGDHVVWLDETVYQMTEDGVQVPLVWPGCTGIVLDIHDGTPPGEAGIDTPAWAAVRFENEEIYRVDCTVTWGKVRLQAEG